MGKFLARLYFCAVPAAGAGIIAAVLSEDAGIAGIFFVGVLLFGWRVTSPDSDKPGRI